MVTGSQKMRWHTDVVYIYTKKKKLLFDFIHTRSFSGDFLIYRVAEDALAHGLCIYIYKKTDKLLVDFIHKTSFPGTFSRGLF